MNKNKEDQCHFCVTSARQCKPSLTLLAYDHTNKRTQEQWAKHGRDKQAKHAITVSDLVQ